MIKIQNNVSVYTGVICEDDVFLGPSCVFTNVINPRSFISRKDEYRKTIVGKENSLNNNSKNGHIKRINSKEDLAKSTKDIIKENQSKKNIKNNQFIIGVQSRENIRKVEPKNNKRIESRNIQKKIESGGRTEFKGRNWLKIHELKNESKRYNYENNNKEIKKDENKNENENNISKNDKKYKKNIKSIFLNLNKKKLRTKNYIYLF